MVVLLRHAHAVSKRAWSGNDEERPLSERGLREAVALVDPLSGIGAQRLISSPCRRCRQTLEPLARQLEMSIDETAVLAPEGAADAFAALAEDPASARAVLCTHGETLAALFVYWRDRGGLLLTPPVERIGKNVTGKSAGWVLEPGGDLVRARYLPPPSLQ